MADTPFNISYNPTTGWSCHPKSQTVPKSTGAGFRNDAGIGCVICFKSLATFGDRSLKLDPGEYAVLPFAREAAAGSGTPFGVYDSTHTCSETAKDEYPFDVTVGSGEGKESHAKEGKAGGY